MIKINKFSVTSDGKWLDIDVAIRSNEYFSNVKLNTIYLDTNDSYSSAGPQGRLKTITFRTNSPEVPDEEIPELNPDDNYGADSPEINELILEELQNILTENFDYTGTISLTTNLQDLGLTTPQIGQFIRSALAAFQIPEPSLTTIANITTIGHLVYIINTSNSSTSGIDLLSEEESEGTDGIDITSNNIIVPDAQSYTLRLDVSDFSNKLFYIYITTKGNPADNTPCGFKKQAEAVAYNEYTLYAKSMGILKQNTCLYDKQFIDKVLMFRAFELAIIAKKYDLVNEYWKQILNIKTGITTKTCNCNNV